MSLHICFVFVYQNTEFVYKSLNPYQLGIKKCLIEMVNLIAKRKKKLLN